MSTIIACEKAPVAAHFDFGALKIAASLALRAILTFLQPVKMVQVRNVSP
jgi:hypothetical protein